MTRWPERLSPILRPRSGLAADVSLVGRLTRQAAALVDAAGALMYPPHCMACGVALSADGNGVLCLACAGRVRWVGTDRCRRCGDRVGEGLGPVNACPACRNRPPAHVEGSAAVAHYGGPLRAVVLGLKFGGGLQAAPFLGKMLGERLKETEIAGEDAAHTMLVPVPLARADFSVRGFNQAEEIAVAVAERIGADVTTKLLRKVKPTPPQAKLDREARRENLRGVFAVDRRAAKRRRGRRAILVDDVMTTGVTASECARVLTEAGIERVHVAVVARGG